MLDEEKSVSESELAHWLAFSMLDGFGCKRVELLLENFDSLLEAWSASSYQLQLIKGIGPQCIASFKEGRKTIDPERLLASFKSSGLKAWTWLDPKFPIHLRHISDPPLLLYVNGDLDPQDLVFSIAVVGTRRPTSYGQRLAKETAKGLASRGVTVVSGMASGIDAFAHWGAIEGGKNTVAVLACGADICYPGSNRDLYDKIVNEGKGAVVSEYFPGTQPEKFRFPARNRIISGLSKALVVVEGAATSGSLISAKLAFDQSRDVFAFPGRVDNPMSEGPHKLIRDNVAQLCTSYEEILQRLDWAESKGGPGRERPQVVQLYGREREVYELIRPEPIHFDMLCERSGMQAGELSATLTILELAGLVSRETGDWYTVFRDSKIRS